MHANILEENFGTNDYNVLGRNTSEVGVVLCKFSLASWIKLISLSKFKAT